MYLDIMRAEEVAGVMLATTNDVASHIHQFGASGIPVVAIDRQVSHADLDTVLVCNQEGAFDAVTHLAQLGHTRIGFIGLPLSLTVGYERHCGYANALLKHGIDQSADLVRIGDAKQSSGYQCACALLDAQPPITALFVANNLMTLGALDAIHQRGIRVPEQLSIVGFDDMPLAAYLRPPLTTVAQPTYQLGQAAAGLLLDRVADPDRPVARVRLKTTLVIRGSTCAPGGVSATTRR
jgi:DNA-binding LacI/PurR family transcriptional regulator